MTESAASPQRTILGGLAVLAVAVVARGAAVMAIATAVGDDLESADPAARRDGLLVGAGVLAGALAGGVVLALVTRGDARRMLALDPPSPRALALWTCGGVALIAAIDLAAVALGRPLVEPAWADAYRTAPWPLLAVALIATSIFEELFFRGFLHGGIAATRLGPAGAIAITSTLFALAHVPDDAFRFADVLASAILLGLARHHTGSSIPGMLPHVLGNLKVLAILAWAS